MEDYKTTSCLSDDEEDVLHLSGSSAANLFRAWFKTRFRCTDGPIFRLHYRLTASCLIVFTVILAARQYVGNPIDCIHTKDIDEDVLNTFCWIHATYSMRNAFKKSVLPTMFVYFEFNMPACWFDEPVCQRFDFVNLDVVYLRRVVEVHCC
ncbi:hypothetical protein RUM43_010619 [Polyplax serrata]|uniref:Innexin n=1 Tax=Polyplax serrata TaxID=468196 RepID=A0AAN8SA08_POLSC